MHSSKRFFFICKVLLPPFLTYFLIKGNPQSEGSREEEIRQKQTLKKHILVIGSTALFSLPLITSPFVVTSEYRFLLTLGIPLLLFYLIGNMVRSEKEVK